MPFLLARAKTYAQRNRFDKDQHGIHQQLGRLAALTRVADPQLFQYLENKDNNAMLFCYRWILIMFKREFAFHDVMRLWERIWTHHLSPNYHIFICVAILQQNRQAILERQLEFDETLKFVNDLAMNIPVDATFEAAEVAQQDKYMKNNFIFYFYFFFFLVACRNCLDASAA